MLQFDPTKPLGSWKKAWSKLTTKAGLTGLRFHDLRHHSITELAESGASEQTIKAIAGHVSERMLARYSHIRLEAKRNALVNAVNAPRTREHRERVNTLNVNTLNTAELTN